MLAPKQGTAATAIASAIAAVRIRRLDKIILAGILILLSYCAGGGAQKT
jgi:hypothetical protein